MISSTFKCRLLLAYTMYKYFHIVPISISCDVCTFHSFIYAAIFKLTRVPAFVEGPFKIFTSALKFLDPPLQFNNIYAAKM